MDIKVFRLLNKKTGKVSSRPDAVAVATAMRATELEKLGLATGIVSLLLPLPKDLQERMQKLQRTCDLVAVAPRRSRRVLDARRRIADPAFRADMLALYLDFLNRKQRIFNGFKPPKSKKAILNWITASQSDEKSPLFQFLRLRAPEIVFDGHGERRIRSRQWWAEQLARHQIK